MDRSREASGHGGEAPVAGPARAVRASDAGLAGAPVAGPSQAVTAPDSGPADCGNLPSNLGVLGGSFNPPHCGHLALARQALRELGIGRALLTPARLSPGKPAQEDPGPGHRLAMCRLAAASVEGLEVCAMELEREGPSYTVDTLRELHGADADIQLTLIVGADVACAIPAWREPGELLGLAGLAVALRAGSGREEVSGALAPLLREVGRRPPGGGISFLGMPVLDVSSSLVRERVGRGLPVEEMVGEAVAAYIAEHGLYLGPGASPPVRADRRRERSEAEGASTAHGDAPEARPGDARAGGGAA